MDSIRKILNLLQDNIVKQSISINDVYIKLTDYKRNDEIPKFDGTWRKFNEEDIWGNQRDTHCWFYTRIIIPEILCNKNVRLSIKTDKQGWEAENPQFLAYINGKVYQGLDLNHTYINLPTQKQFDLHLYAYSATPDVSGNNEKFGAKLFLSYDIIDEQTEGLYYDVLMPFEILSYLDEKDEDYITLLNILTNTIKILDFTDIHSKSYDLSVECAKKYINKNLYSKKWNNNLGKITLVGHTHLDIAWFWTIKQAREKAQRSFATQISLLKKYDDFRFMSSQAYLYQAVKEECPNLYKDMCEMIKLGKWDVEGSAWVECDCNIPSGESIVRQFLYGKKFFKNEFDIDTKIFWEPDVFGYCASLPQILKKCDINTFITSKISWNDTNRMPYDLFLWKGIDGTEVLTYFITTTPKRKGLPVINGTGYVSRVTANEVAGTYERFEPKRLADDLLCLYGWGDGGGGVTEDMQNRLYRLKNGLPSCPRVEENTATNYFKNLHKYVKNKELPKWDGELYLEYHRGTYTTRARNKKSNVMCEALLKKCELLCTIDNILNGTEYPHKRLENLWKQVLLYQFHDILPGSSIREVYDDTDKGYEEIIGCLNELIKEHSENILPKTDKDETVLINSTANSGVNLAYDKDGVFECTDIASLGYSVINKNREQKGRIEVGDNVLENEFYHIDFNNNGQIKNFIYKPSKRNILKRGSLGNVLRCYEDRPFEYDAWNIDKNVFDKYQDVINLTSIENVVEKCRSGKKFTWKFNKSTIWQTVWLYERTDNVDFETQIDWQEEHILLKTVFPIEINTGKASYGIQFGEIERATHNNTSWDEAKFEVPAQRYAYMKEDGFGVALCSDSKYGYSIKNGQMTLSLLRSPMHPCKNADKGNHEFTYRVICGNDDIGIKACLSAEALAMPIIATKGIERNSTPKRFELCKIDANNVVVDAVKKSEDSKGVVIRMHEFCNKQTKCEVKFGFNVKTARIANLVEKKGKELKVNNGGVILDIKPYEIITLIVE